MNIKEKIIANIKMELFKEVNDNSIEEEYIYPYYNKALEDVIKLIEEL